MRPVIGFIGLGNMGQPMAANLLKAGYPVRVWNRSPGPAAALAAQGAASVSRPEEVAEPGAFVISSLANDQVLEEVVGTNQELLRGSGPEAFTSRPARLRRNGAVTTEGHKPFGVTYLAAPVLGRPDAAAAAKLWVFLSGPAEAKERARPVLQALGQGVFDLGEDSGAANVVKLACNFLIASAIEAMAEALTLAQKNGIEAASWRTCYCKPASIARCTETMAGRSQSSGYEPSLFKLSLGLKDISLLLQTAAASKVPMPLADVLHNHLLAADAKGRGNLDWTGLAGEVSEAAGL